MGRADVLWMAELFLPFVARSGTGVCATTAASSRTFVPPAMMTGIRIPSAGCWEVTGHYRSKSLSFTVSVQP